MTLWNPYKMKNYSKIGMDTSEEMGGGKWQQY